MSETALAKIPTWDEAQKALAKRTVCKGANDDEFNLFMAVCQRTGLDPFARQIYSIRRKQWNSQTRAYEEAQITQVSIDGFRLIADRTSKYAGQVGPWWCDKSGEWREVWLEDEPPAAAKVGVLRRDFHQPIFSVAVHKSYVQTNAHGDPVSRWKTDPAGMLAKCAEALALRRAFPQELSGLYTSEEMGQASSGQEAQTVEWQPAPDPEPAPEIPVVERPAPSNGKTSQPREMPDPFPVPEPVDISDAVPAAEPQPAAKPPARRGNAGPTAYWKRVADLRQAGKVTQEQASTIAVETGNDWPAALQRLEAEYAA
jgi:phage recombination protein Bet